MKPLHILAAALSLASATLQAQEISFGIIATDAAAAQRERWEPFFRDMEQKTGLKVKSFYAPDYAGVIEAMRFNKIQVAWYGNKSAMEAVDRAEGEVFAQVMFSDGSYGYHGLLVTHKDSPYHTLDDVFRNGKSINFGIGDPNSTSGFLVPTFYVFAQVSPECSALIASAWGAELISHPSAGHDLPLDDGPWLAQQVAAWSAAQLPTKRLR